MKGHFSTKWQVPLIAILIALAPIAPGGTYGESDFFSSLKMAGRIAVYGILLTVILIAVVRVLTSPKVPRPGYVAIGYSFLYTLIGLKMFGSGFFTSSILFLGSAAGYLLFFGFFLPRQKNAFSLQKAVTAIGFANVMIVSINLYFSIFGGLSSFGGRVSGFAFNPNVLAYSCALTCCCVPAATLHFGKFRLLGTIILCAGNAVIVLSTLSRGALVILALALIVVALQSSRRYRSYVLLSIPAVGFVALVQLINSPVLKKVFEGRENTRSWVFERQMSRFSDSPIIGGSWDEPLIVYGENMYLGVLSELGVLGGIALGLVLIPLFWNLSRLYIRQSTNVHCRMALAFVFLMMASGLLEAPLLGVVHPAIFGLLALDAGARYSQSQFFRTRRKLEFKNENPAHQPDILPGHVLGRADLFNKGNL